jgi:hypothetical protein
VEEAAGDGEDGDVPVDWGPPGPIPSARRVGAARWSSQASRRSSGVAVAAAIDVGRT